MNDKQTVKKERKTIRRSPEYKKALSDSFRLLAEEMDKHRGGDSSLRVTPAQEVHNGKI